MADVAARASVPAVRVMRTLLAASIQAKEEAEVPDDLVSFVAAFEQGAALMGEEAILAFTRVLGAAANNVAEATIGLFYGELGPAPTARVSTKFPGPGWPGRNDRLCRGPDVLPRW